MKAAWSSTRDDTDPPHSPQQDDDEDETEPSIEILEALHRDPDVEPTEHSTTQSMTTTTTIDHHYPSFEQQQQHANDHPSLITTTTRRPTTTTTTALARHYAQRYHYVSETLPRQKWQALYHFCRDQNCAPYPPHHVGYVDLAIVDLYDGGEPSWIACWSHFRNDMVIHLTTTPTTIPAAFIPQRHLPRPGLFTRPCVP